MKTHDKLNLASQIYQDRPYAKTPIPSLNHLQQQQANKKKFINICCPNCRYLFKIAKQPKYHEQPISFIPANLNHRQQYNNYDANPNFNNSTNHHQQKTHLFQNVEVQTDQHLIKSLTTSPKKQKSAKELTRTQHMLTDRTPEKSPFILNIKKTITPSSFSARNYLENQKQQPFPTDRSTPQKQQTSLSIDIINSSRSKSKSKKQQFPIKAAYKVENNYSLLNNSQQKCRILNQKISNLKAPLKQKQHPKPQPKIFQELPSYDIKTRLSDQLLQKIYLSQQIGQIIKYQMNLPNQLSVPSYCKMLAYELKDRRQETNKKQLQIPNNQKQIQNEDEQDLPRFSTTLKK